MQKGVCKFGLRGILRDRVSVGALPREMELRCAGSQPWPWASVATDVLEKGVVEEAVFRENLQKLSEVSAPTF